MKKIIVCIIVLLVISCVDNEKEKVVIQRDTIKPKVPNDSILLALSREILTAIKKKDYQSFAGYFHPAEGVRFSPYGYPDSYIKVDNDVKFKKNEFINKLQQKADKINWGIYKRSGDSIQLSIEEYFKKFIYDVDFLSEKKLGVNEILNKGNNNHINEGVYKDCYFINKYFPEIDKNIYGKDYWRRLSLVFKEYDDNYYLVGIIHDEWTI